MQFVAVGRVAAAPVIGNQDVRAKAALQFVAARAAIERIVAVFAFKIVGAAPPWSSSSPDPP